MEKSFDSVEWSHLFSMLQRFGLGKDFIRWVKISTQPMMAVIANVLRSKNVMIQRDTRQSCPLSPLLFPIEIEPLAKAIRQEAHKITLYADDVSLFLLTLFKLLLSSLPFLDTKLISSKQRLCLWVICENSLIHPNLSPFKWSPVFTHTYYT